jgi:hypothetical protein
MLCQIILCTLVVCDSCFLESNSTSIYRLLLQRGLLSSHDAGVGQVKHESVGDLGSTHTLQLPLM